MSTHPFYRRRHSDTQSFAFFFQDLTERLYYRRPTFKFPHPLEKQFKSGIFNKCCYTSHFSNAIHAVRKRPCLLSWVLTTSSLPWGSVGCCDSSRLSRTKTTVRLSTQSASPCFNKMLRRRLIEFSASSKWRLKNPQNLKFFGDGVITNSLAAQSLSVVLKKKPSPISRYQGNLKKKNNFPPPSW